MRAPQTALDFRGGEAWFSLVAFLPELSMMASALAGTYL